jgi:hypothetical protein
MEDIDRLREKKRKEKQLLLRYEKTCNEPYEEITLLKVKLEEAKNIEDILKQKLKEAETKGEKLEAKVVTITKDLEKFQALYHQNLTSIKASEGLASILNQQRNSKLKIGLGYEYGSSSGHPSNKESIKFFKSTTIDNNKPAETKEENQPPRRSERKANKTESVEQRNNTPSTQGNHQHGRNRPTQRRQPFSRYKDFFYGYCFHNSNFGQKVVNCSLIFRHEQSRQPRNKYLPQQRMRSTSNKQPQTANHVMVGKRMHITHNKCYDPLFNEPECYIFHNCGHKVADCRLKNYKPDSNHRDENVKVWKKNEDNKCVLVLSSQRQKDTWCIDSGCSSHMTGDTSKFLLLKENKSGSVTFGNDAP